MSLDIRLGPAPSGPGATDVPSSARSSGPGPETSVGPTTVPPESGSVAIASLAQYAGRHVTVAGLVTDTATSTATIDDGTGEVRIGGASAAEAISMLEPGDAIDARLIGGNVEDGNSRQRPGLVQGPRGEPAGLEVVGSDLAEHQVRILHGSIHHHARNAPLFRLL